MHQHNATLPQAVEPGDAIRLVLGMARRLHKAARSDSLADSLPVLRRLLASDALHDMSLPELQRKRSMVRRKHILRMLALEAGYPAWETYRNELTNMAVEELEHFDLMRSAAGYPNHWFSSVADALEYAGTHGGRAVRVGRQAVVVDVAPHAEPEVATAGS